MVFAIVGLIAALGALGVAVHNHRRLKREHHELFNGGWYS